MTLFNLPHPIAAFVDILEKRDTAALLALFAPGAVVKGCHPKYGGQTIEDWNAHDFIGAPTGVHPIGSGRMGEKFLLTVLIGYGPDRAATGAARQFDWSFTIAGDLITELMIAPARMPALGSAIATFVNATNACDLDGVVATFAEDALVNDQLHEHWGRAAIREWAASEMIADKVTILVVGVVDHHGHSIVTANIDGNYDKRGLPEPLVLTFYFSATTEQIVQLIVLRNLADM